ncbi:ricin-type beta-trefoil lectin domain protein [Streptomyces sp. NPDC048636]|uniref:ricin-type beta-trefoil lectin domain protein n=1 Tax=Streptomyces sp. NPDC048636 TaxID=3155762 RepID=UPI00343BBEBE
MGFTGKRRISIIAACAAAAAVAGGLQLSSSAFGTDDNEPGDRHRPVAAAPHQDDFGISDTDGTAFKNGVLPVKSSDVRGMAAATPAHGEGWKLAGPGKSLSTGYTIKFYDQKSVDWLGRYVKTSAKELRRVTNLPINVDTTPVGWDYTRPKGVVVIGVLKRPCVPPKDGGQHGWKVVRDGSGAKNLSCGLIASSVPDTVTSGHAYIDSEFFTSAGKPLPSVGDKQMSNHISHELGHTMGLSHANRSSTRGDCAVAGDSGQKPVMCSPAGGYQDSRAGTYVQQFDVQGLRHLAKGGGAALSPQGRVTGLGGKCLDVKAGNPANGTQIQLYKCNGSATQSWILDKDGSFHALGKCLANAHNATADGNKIELHDCDGGASQRWSVNAKGQIVHLASGKVLDVTGGKTTDGTKIQLHSANSYKRQVWVAPK